MISSCRTYTCQVRLADSLISAQVCLIHASLVLLTSFGWLADMDGFRLLEQIGLEMDLPVISERLHLSFCRHVFAAMTFASVDMQGVWL